MISIVTKWWIKEGREDAAKLALADLAQQVKEEEPFTAMYLIHTSIVEGSLPSPAPNEVIFVGTWTDRAAFEKHLVGPVFKDWLALHIQNFIVNNDGSLYVNAEFVDRFAGFIRPSQITPEE
jgi:quinol monooxygenase YgiN